MKTRDYYNEDGLNLLQSKLEENFKAEGFRVYLNNNKQNYEFFSNDDIVTFKYQANVKKMYDTVRKSINEVGLNKIYAFHKEEKADGAKVFKEVTNIFAAHIVALYFFHEGDLSFIGESYHGTAGFLEQLGKMYTAEYKTERK